MHPRSGLVIIHLCSNLSFPTFPWKPSNAAGWRAWNCHIQLKRKKAPAVMLAGFISSASVHKHIVYCKGVVCSKENSLCSLQDLHFSEETLLLSFSNVSFCCFEHLKPGAMLFHYMHEKADQNSNSATHTKKSSRWINRTIGKKENMHVFCKEQLTKKITGIKLIPGRYLKSQHLCLAIR